MKLVIGTRGSKEPVDLFIKELSSKYLLLPFRDKKTGEIRNVTNAIHVQPIQLWAINFPKEYQDLILTTIFKESKNTGVNNPYFKKIFKWLCKFLPLNKMPTDWDTSKHLPIQNKDIEIIGFGTKESTMRTANDIYSDEQLKNIGLDPKAQWEFEAL